MKIQQQNNKVFKKKGEIFKRLIAGMLALAMILTGGAFGDLKLAKAAGTVQVYLARKAITTSNPIVGNGYYISSWEGNYIGPSSTDTGNAYSSPNFVLANKKITASSGYTAKYVEEHLQISNESGINTYNAPNLVGGVSVEIYGYRIYALGSSNSFSFGSMICQVDKKNKTSSMSSAKVQDGIAIIPIYEYKISTKTYHFTGGWINKSDSTKQYFPHNTGSLYTNYDDTDFFSKSENYSAAEDRLYNSILYATDAKELTAPTPTRLGYTFAGWSKTSAGTVMSSSELNVFNMEGGDGDVYAVWNPNQYTISYNSCGGTCNKGSDTIYYNSSVGILPRPSKTGYTFLGWYTDASGGTKVEDNSAYNIVGNTTLYAHWSINSNTLNFIVDNNTVKTVSEIPYGTSLEQYKPAVPTKPGYTFVNWNNLPSTMPDAAVNATANWSVNVHKVYFNDSDGTRIRTADVPYGANVASYATTPTKPGYNFSGWSNIPSTMPDKDITVTATWDIKNYSVTCIDRCGSTVLGSNSWNASYGDKVDGTKFGTNTTKIGEYYDNYRLVDWSSTTVGENGAVVYRNFEKYDNMTGITLSDDLSTIIKADADVTKVHITREDGITKIADEAFSGCSKLTSVLFDNKTITTIGNNAFENCNSEKLTEIVLPYSTKSIGNNVFYGCSNLKKITVKNPECEFGENAIPAFIDIAGFTGSSADVYCKNGSKIMTAVTDIYDGFFEYEELKEFVVPDDVTNIGESAFRSCEQLTSITLGSSVETIGAKAFQNTSITNLTIPASVTEISGNEAFADTKLVKVTFAENSHCKSIGGSTFARCPLKYYTNPVPERGEDIEADEENNIKAVKTEVFVVPASVNAVSASAFTGCKQIGQISIFGMHTEITGDADIPATTIIGCYKDSKAYEYAKKYHYPIALFAGYDADGTTAIENGTYAGDEDIVSIGIGHKLETIGDSAFENCTSLKEISAGDGDTSDYALTTIGDSAFNNCTSLEKVNLPNNTKLETVGDAAFAGCSSLKLVIIYNPNCNLKNDGTTFDKNTELGGWSKSTIRDYANTYGNAFTSSAGTSYQIIFNKNGGKGGTDKVYVCGEMTLPEITIPEYTGRTFTGYYVNDTQYYDSKGKCVFTNTITLTDDLMGNDAPVASWTINQYKVSYDANSGIGIMDDSSNISYDQNYKLDANTFTKDGYVFDGWNTKADGSGAAYEDTETVKNLTDKDNMIVVLFAQWKPIEYSIVFTENGGSIKCTEKLDMVYDVDAEMPEYAGVKENYTFGGWNTKADGTGVNFEAGKAARNITNTQEEVTLYARWIPVEYNIDYSLSGGYLKEGKENPLSYNVDTETFTLNNPLKRGYEFMGWSGTDITGVAKKVTIKKGTTGTRSYTAHWGDKVDYIISYELNGGKLKEGKENPSHYDVDTETFTLSNPVKEGYQFVGWRLNDEENTNYTVTLDEGSTGNRKYTAVWKIGVYDVTLHLNGGSYADGVTELTDYTYGIGAALPSKLKKKGYAFAGWSTKQEADTVDVINIGPDEYGDKEFYAVWDYRPDKTISISYVDTDGSKIVVPEKYTKADYVDNVDDIVSLPTYTEVVKSGCAFAGWYDNPEYSGKVYSEFVFDGTQDDIVFYAKWSSEKYNITYEVGDGVIEGDIADSYYYGQEVKLPRNVIKDGYNFMGWYDNPEYIGTPVTAVPVDTKGDVKYYAKLSTDAYRIIYYTNGGQIGNNNITEYHYGQSVNLTTDIERNGCTFLGWYEEKDFSGDIVNEIPEGSVGNKIFYAKWSPKTYKITYVENGGKIVGDYATKYIFNQEQMLPSRVERNCYTFAGWYDNEDLSGDEIVSVSPDTYGNKTYFAKWIPNKYKVNLELNGGLLAEPYKINSYIYGKQIVLPIPVKDGYTFAGWYVNSNLSGKSIDFIGTDEYGDKTFYAKWTNGVSSTINNGDDGLGVAGHSALKKTVKAVKTVTVGKMKYSLSKSTAKVIGVKSKKYKSISIPSIIKKKGKTYKVTSIGAKAFKGMKKLKKVTVGKNVKIIGKSAVASDKKLKKIIFKGKKVKKVGSKAIKGIYKKAIIKVPKSKRASYKKLLKKKGLKSTMKVK